MSGSEDENIEVNLQTLKQKRSAIKGKLTRIERYVQNFDADRHSMNEIKVRQGDLEQLIQRFEELQLQIELIDDAADRQDIHEEERSAFEDRFYGLKACMMSALTARSPIPTVAASLSRHSDQSNCTHYDHAKPRVKLPQLELPKFDGDIRQWPAFKNIFYASVDSTDLPVVNKLQYLKTALTGEAAGLIASLLIIEENYSKALEILAKRYENQTIIVNFHLKSITSFSTITRNNLKEYLVLLQQSLDSLRAIQLPVEHWDALLVFLITQKLDNSLRAAWEINRKENSIASLSELLDFLNQRRTAFELMYDSKSNNDKIQNVKVSHVASTTIRETCILCNSGHALHKCPTYLELTTQKRIELIKSKSLCYNCLQPYKFRHKCSKFHCLKCKGKHHTSIHEDRPQPQVNHITTTNSQQANIPTQSTDIQFFTKPPGGRYYTCNSKHFDNSYYTSTHTTRFFTTN